MIHDDDPFDLEKLKLSTDLIPERLAVVPWKIRKRRQHHISVPWVWYELLEGATGQTHRVALLLLYRHWKDGGKPIKLANGMLKIDGISRQSKWRALTDLERRGLILIERHAKRSPVVRVNLSPS